MLEVVVRSCRKLACLLFLIISSILIAQVSKVSAQVLVKPDEYVVIQDKFSTQALSDGSDFNSAAQEVASDASHDGKVSLMMPRTLAATQSSALDASGGVPYDAAKHAAFCAELRKHSSYKFCEPNYIYKIDATVPNDPNYSALWGMQKISAASAWDISTGSSDVVVAVIDTGVDYTHPELANNIWSNPGEIPGNGIDDDGDGIIDDVHGANFVNGTGNPMDDNSHGTHCSGTIGGEGNNGIGVAGVNWHVKIMAVKFLNSGGSGSLFDAIKGINYAVARGAKIISASWGGGGFSQGLYDAIKGARDAGVLFVAAAGNNGLNSDLYPSYPAAYDLDNIISVAATTKTDTLASFSNYGATTVDIGAPGVSILSTVPGGYDTYSGTSMATPHVAGLAALVKSVNSGLNYSQLKARVLDGDPVPALNGVTLTGKRINAYRALTSSASAPDNGTPVTSPSPASITDFVGINGKHVIVNGKGFRFSVSGTPGSSVEPTLSFVYQRTTLGTCSLPASIIGASGSLTVTGNVVARGILRGSGRLALAVGAASKARRFVSREAASHAGRKYTRQQLKHSVDSTCQELSATIASSN